MMVDMTEIVVEVRNLKYLDKDTLKILKRLSFGSRGWMVECIDQILKGYTVTGFYDPATDEVATEKIPVVYSKGHALIARNEEGKIIGWALVRHPSKRIKIKYRDWDMDERSFVTKYAYGGRRSDFMVYVKGLYRKQRVARTLLLVAYNNFGRMDAYPHDKKSRGFYERNKRLVTPYDTNKFSNAHFKSREVF